MQHRSALLLALALVTAGCISHCSAAQQVIDIATVVEAVKPQVAQAKSSGSPITIQLQEAFYNVTAPLRIDVTNPVHINIPVTITGQGPDKTVLDCGYVSAAMSILGAGAVSVSNLTIQKCLAAHQFGGSVFIEPSQGVHDIAFSNCRFIGNRAQVSMPPGMGPGPPGGLAAGGALYIRPAYQSIPSARLLIDNCTFENNTARDGGAVYSTSSGMSVAITNTVFKGNNATETGGAVFITATIGGRGPGALHPNTTHTISGCTFINNTAGQEAGGLWALTYRFNVTDTTFEGNSAGPTVASQYTPPGMAGAVSLYPAQVDPPAPSGHAFNIVRCSFTNNTAIQVPVTISPPASVVRGAGGVLLYLPDQATAVVADSIFKGNKASDASAMLVVVKYQGTPSGSGGPVGRPTAKMTIINTSFQDNTETDTCTGGFSLFNDPRTASNTVVLNFSVTNSTFGDAERPSCVQKPPSFPSWIEGLAPQINQAIKTSSPINVQLNATVYNMTIPLVIDLFQSQFYNNSVTITGQGPDKTVLDCGGYGRGIVIGNAGTVSISNLTIQNCDTTKTRPGLPQPPSIPMLPPFIQSTLNGPAVYMNLQRAGSNVSFTNCRFTGNNMVTDTSPCVAQACAGGYGGGAVFVTADPINRISFSIHNSTFENNSAPTGGGVYVYADVNNTSITDSVFQGNNATYSSGGGLGFAYGNGNYFLVSRCRFTNNWAARSGAGLEGSARYMVISDSTFEDNRAGRAGNANYSLGTGAGASLVGASGKGITILRSRFTRNYASQRAAGASVLLIPYKSGYYDNPPYQAYLDIQNSLFQDNDAPQASALAVDSRMTTGNVTLVNVTSTNNTGTDCKGGVNITGATSVSVTNSTLEGSGTKLCIPDLPPGSASPPVSRRSLGQFTATRTPATEFPTRRSMHRRRVRVSRRRS